MCLTFATLTYSQLIFITQIEMDDKANQFWYSLYPKASLKYIQIYNFGYL